MVSSAFLSQVEHYFTTGHSLEDAIEHVLKDESYQYIHQPNGSQRAPDFLASYRGTWLPIEAKATKNGTIMWNDGVPQPGFIYIYGNIKLGKCTSFLDYHVITPPIRLMSETAKKDLKAHVSVYNDQIGMTLLKYLRPHFAFNSFNPLKCWCPLGDTKSLTKEERESEVEEFINGITSN